MTIVYLYTALCTVGGADRSIIQKANYLADEMHQDVFPDFITFLRHHIAHNDNQRVT